MSGIYTLVRKINTLVIVFYMFHIESLKGRDHIKGYVYQRYFFWGGGNNFPHLGQVNVGPWQAAECLKIISLISVSSTKCAFLVKFSKI